MTKTVSSGSGGAHSGGTQASPLLTTILAELDAHKAEDVVVIPLAGKASFADALVIATGTSSRHLSSLATTLARALKEGGFYSHGLEGAAHGSDWVCLDCGDIVVHLFQPAARTLYNLEKLWSHNFDAAV